MFAGSYTWGGADLTAMNLVEDGHDDWRLPTLAEAQAAIQSGTLGPLVPNLSAGNYIWTSTRKGNKRYGISVASDSFGNVIPGQSGAAVLFTPGNALLAIAVRP